MLKVNTLTNSVLWYQEKVSKSTKRHSSHTINEQVVSEVQETDDSSKRLVTLSARQKTQIREHVNLMYKERALGVYPKFVTVTTCQHKNGLTDAECKAVFANWIKLRGFNKYVYICERQTDTNDIHFHMVLFYDEKLNINDEVKYFNERYKGTNTHVFNVRLLDKEKKVSQYLTKYVTKNKSTFETKASQISYALKALYREVSHKYIEIVSDFDDCADSLHDAFDYFVSCKPHVQYTGDFYTVTFFKNSTPVKQLLKIFKNAKQSKIPIH